eukprot:gene14804-biopygen23134
MRGADGRRPGSALTRFSLSLGRWARGRGSGASPVCSPLLKRAKCTQGAAAGADTVQRVHDGDRCELRNQRQRALRVALRRRDSPPACGRREEQGSYFPERVSGPSTDTILGSQEHF